MTAITLVSDPRKKGYEIDVVFVHGATGDDKNTWSNDDDENGFWPKWLDREFKKIRVHSAKLDLPLSNLSVDSMKLLETSKAFAQSLNLKKIGTRPLVFIVHSFGGIVVKKLLHLASQGTLANVPEIMSSTKAIFFIATPHQGSGYASFFRWAGKKFGVTSPTEQVLERNSEVLRELGEWFSNYYSNNQAFKVVYAYETVKTLHSLVVDESSANPNVVGATSLPVPKDHSEICKPMNKEDIVYGTAVGLITEVYDSIAKDKKKIPAKSKISATPGSEAPKNIGQLIDMLDNDFSFRWEKRNVLDSDRSPDVFWPIRLREPTPIHAVQAFAAAALQCQGATIHLYLDDLGTVDFKQDQFINRISSWFAKAGGNFATVATENFKILLSDQGHSSSINPWKWAKALLGDTDDKLGETLRLSKLLPPKDETSLDGEDMQILARSRPRRLLALPNVRACLDHLISVKSAGAVITLGGYDEHAMWKKLVEKTNSSNHRIGNLFIPILQQGSQSVGANGSPLYMGTAPGTLSWNSKDDIRSAFDAEQSDLRGDLKKAGRLVSWCYDNCVKLNARLENRKGLLSLSDIPDNELKRVWVDEVAKAIL